MTKRPVLGQLLTDDEAAGMLNISLAGLKELVAGEVLRPVGDVGRRFDAAEVWRLLNCPASDEPLTDAEPERPVLGPAHVAALYGVDRRTVAVWDRKGLLPPSFRTPGRQRRWYADEIMAQLNASRSWPPPP